MSKTMLPIRAEVESLRGFPQIVLHFEAPVRNGLPQPMRHIVGPPLEDNTKPYYRDPLGVAILRIMGLFFETEAKAEALQKECERLTAENKGLAKSTQEAEQQINRLKGQLSAHNKRGG